MKHLICKRSLLVAAAGVLLALAPGQAEEKKKAAAEEDIYTHTYVVPPSFQSSLEGLAKEIQEEAAENRKNREGLKKAFERCGVTFPEGASVTYSPATSTMIIRNTKGQMAGVEALIERLTENRKHARLQVYVTIKEIRFNPKELRNLKGEKEGFDWLISSLTGPDSDGVHEAANAAQSVSSKEALLAEMSRPPTPPAPRGMGEIAGVFTDPQFQMVIRALVQMKGPDVLSAPPLMLRSGQGGLSQVEKKRWGVVPVAGPDNLTIDLSLYLPPEGEALYPKNAKVCGATASVTIWDGQTVAYRDRIDEDDVRIVFVTAKMVDPAGLAVNRNEKSEKPKPEAVPVKSRPAAEIEKEREAIRAADRIALRGYDKLLAGDFKGAAADFEAALKKLPEDSGLRRDSFEAQLKKARAGLKQLPNTK